jgi:hypothetical protein
VGRSTGRSGGDVNDQPELWKPSAGINRTSINRISSCTSRGSLPEICQKRRLAKPGAASLDVASPTPFACDDVMQRTDD